MQEGIQCHDECECDRSFTPGLPEKTGEVPGALSSLGPMA
jgi:hypothetical protein